MYLSADDDDDDGDICLLPGCTSPKYVEASSGRVHDFCRKTHAMEYIAVYGQCKFYRLDLCPQNKLWIMNSVYSLQLLSIDQLPHVSPRADLFFFD